MVACVYGFPNQIDALRFEWAWQNPTRSIRLKHHTTLSRDAKLKSKLAALAAMLHTPTWVRLPLTLQWFNSVGHACLCNVMRGVQRRRMCV